MRGLMTRCSAPPDGRKRLSGRRLCRVSHRFTQTHWAEKKIGAGAATRSGEPLPISSKLRLDYGALTALLDPTPTTAICRSIRNILNVIIFSKRVPAGSMSNVSNYRRCWSGWNSKMSDECSSSQGVAARRQCFRYGSRWARDEKGSINFTVWLRGVASGPRFCRLYAGNP